MIHLVLSIRTRIVMVYRQYIDHKAPKQAVFVQELLWFIPLRKLGEAPKSFVFVQELLWFILRSGRVENNSNKYSYKNCYGLSRTFIDSGGHYTKYSYKNCYGLSALLIFASDSLQKYSYKNCYGLSSMNDSKVSILILYSYKNCYGLSKPTLSVCQSCDTVFVQELLWFIVFTNNTGLNNSLKYSYKNCYGLSAACCKILKKFSPVYSYKNCYGLSLVKSRFVISSIA